MFYNYFPDRSERVTLAKGRTGQSPIDVQLQARKKVAKMLIAVVVVFALCYLPVHVLGILRCARMPLYTCTSGTFMQEGVNTCFCCCRYANVPMHEVTAQVALVAHWLCYFNSAVNPVIYNFMSGQLFTCFCFFFALACKSVAYTVGP